MLGRLEGEDCSVDDLRLVQHAVHLEIANVKTAMGWREEALEKLKNFLEIKDLTLDEEMEVAHVRRILGVIYSGMKEHEKALEQNQLSLKVRKNWGLIFSDLLRVEIDAANMQLALGIYDEMHYVIKKNSRTQRYDYKLPMGFSKKKIVSLVEVSEAYLEISMQYETMNEREAAILLLKRWIYSRNSLKNNTRKQLFHRVDDNALVPFEHRMGLISHQLYEEVSNVCKGNYYPPNSTTCWDKLNKVDQDISGLNIYDILESCYHDLESG
ncbi:hypothetical protein ACFE04_024240 [Oxalis oulophora]